MEENKELGKIIFTLFENGYSIESSENMNASIHDCLQAVAHHLGVLCAGTVNDMEDLPDDMTFEKAVSLTKMFVLECMDDGIASIVNGDVGEGALNIEDIPTVSK